MKRYLAFLLLLLFCAVWCAPATEVRADSPPEPVDFEETFRYGTSFTMEPTGYIKARDIAWIFKRTAGPGEWRLRVVYRGSDVYGDSDMNANHGNYAFNAGNDAMFSVIDEGYLKTDLTIPAKTPTDNPGALSFAAFLDLDKVPDPEVYDISRVVVQFEYRVEVTDFPDTFRVAASTAYSPSVAGDSLSDRAYAQFVVYKERGRDGEARRTYLPGSEEQNFANGQGVYATPDADGNYDWINFNVPEKTITISEKDPKFRYYVGIRVVGVPVTPPEVNVYIDHMSLKVTPSIIDETVDSENIPADYVKVTVNPTDKATETETTSFWVARGESSVDLTPYVTEPTGKTEADGSSYTFTGWSRPLTGPFDADTEIEAEYDTVEPTQPTTIEPETTSEPEETETEPQATTESDTALWEDTELVAAQAEGVESISLSQVYVNGILLTEQAAADMGGIELVVEPKGESRIPGRIVNRSLIDGRRNYFYDIYLLNKQTGARLNNVSATVPLQEGSDSLDDVQAFVLNAIPNSGDYELQETPVTIQGNTATFYGPHFSYYCLSFGYADPLPLAYSSDEIRIVSEEALRRARKAAAAPEENAAPKVAAPKTESKVDAAKVNEPQVVQIPATGESGLPLAVAALLFTAAAGLLLKRRR